MGSIKKNEAYKNLTEEAATVASRVTTALVAAAIVIKWEVPAVVIISRALSVAAAATKDEGYVKTGMQL